MQESEAGGGTFLGHCRGISSGPRNYLPVNQKSTILLKNHREIARVVAFSGQS